MRICLHPFYSQQDKALNKFSLGTDSGVAWMLHLARSFASDGHDVRLVTPLDYQCADFDRTLHAVHACLGGIIPAQMPLDNHERRLHWDTQLYKSIAKCDLVVTHCELSPVPLRALHPDLTIVSECAFDPASAFPTSQHLFPLAWRASTLVLCSNGGLAKLVRDADAEGVVLEYAYDESIANAAPVLRDIDVVFNARSSATGYSNSVLFVEALSELGLRVAVTDPTKHFRVSDGCPSEWRVGPLPRDEYVKLLHRTKVVVCLTDNGSVPTALREAVVCGCRPVVLDLPQFAAFPHRCRPTPEDVQRAVVSALRSNLPLPMVGGGFRRAYEELKELLQ